MLADHVPGVLDHYVGVAIGLLAVAVAWMLQDMERRVRRG